MRRASECRSRRAIQIHRTSTTSVLMTACGIIGINRKGTMRLKLLAAVVAISLSASAQMTMSVDKLVEFIRSSIERKQPDKEVAGYLRTVKLNSRLDDWVIEDLQALGAGAKTLAALRDLRDASAKLPAAPLPPRVQAAVPPPDPPDSEKEKVLADATENVLNYEKSLPNFICGQVTRRYVAPAGTSDWSSTDTIFERLTYFEHHEDYKVVTVNNQIRDIPHDRLGGAVSSGEFGSVMAEIFSAKTETEFAWKRWATLRDKRMHVYSFRVRSSRSNYHIQVPEQSLNIIAGYQGEIFIGNEDHFVHRIALQAEDIPPTYPVQDVKLTLDYKYSAIGAQDYLLPYKFELESRMDRVRSRNDVAYRSYQKFGADATITFDTPEPIPPDQTKEQPVKQETPPVKKKK